MLSVSHMREPIRTIENVLSQTAVIEARDFYLILSSRIVLHTLELRQIADNVPQILAH